jgi:hypothetical protein
MNVPSCREGASGKGVIAGQRRRNSYGAPHAGRGPRTIMQARNKSVYPLTVVRTTIVGRLSSNSSSGVQRGRWGSTAVVGSVCATCAHPPTLPARHCQSGCLSAATQAARSPIAKAASWPTTPILVPANTSLLRRAARCYQATKGVKGKVLKVCVAILEAEGFIYDGFITE